MVINFFFSVCTIFHWSTTWGDRLPILWLIWASNQPVMKPFISWVSILRSLRLWRKMLVSAMGVSGVWPLASSILWPLLAWQPMAMVFVTNMVSSHRRFVTVNRFVLTQKGPTPISRRAWLIMWHRQRISFEGFKLLFVSGWGTWRLVEVRKPVGESSSRVHDPCQLLR